MASCPGSTEKVDVSELVQHLVACLSKQDQKLDELLMLAKEGSLRIQVDPGSIDASMVQACMLPYGAEFCDKSSIVPTHTLLESQDDSSNSTASQSQRPVSSTVCHDLDVECSRARQASVMSQASRATVRDLNHQRVAHLKAICTNQPTNQPLGQEDKRSFRTRISSLVSSRQFEVFIMTLIITNVITMTIDLELELVYRPSKVSSIFQEINTLHNFVFFLEFFLKLFAWGPWNYFAGVDGAWNRLDFMIVVVSSLEEVVNRIGMKSLPTDQMRVIRVLRLARTCRAIKIVRVLRMVGPLRALLLSIAHALPAVMWTLTLLLCVLFCCGTIYAQAVGDFCREEAAMAIGHVDVVPNCNSQDMKDLWGSLGRSMLTLYMSIVGGVDWIKAIHPLYHVSYALVILFCVYVGVTGFAILNLVTGIFCQNALESASADKDHQLLVHMSQMEAHSDTIRHIFEELDTDASGELTFAELQEKIGDERLASLWSSIDIDTQEVWTLFSLMDTDRSGSIDIDEFMFGCLNLRGNAKAIHLAKIKREQKVAREMLNDLRLQIEALRDDVMDRSSMHPICLHALNDKRLRHGQQNPHASLSL
eukprot:TRINITY_DN103019_c0_g1_i1.p1 TRINITY_DN103019_c0_g1~~TRINITY_DN103019_c0_g1_i1.p1  ORF type:complete len:613 (+),score=88.57 TRINITY_DN103019_c0_g1_i1:64-1839(+)